MKRIFTLILFLILLAASAGGSSNKLAFAQSDAAEGNAAILGTAFTYQGRLVDGGEPANGSYDLRFILYNASAGGSQVGAAVPREDVVVSEGYFTVLIDFGSVFDGQALWLEVSVRPGGDTGEYSVLSPRQPLTAAPNAAYSLEAPWNGLIGVPAGFADGSDDNTTYTAGDGLTLAGGQFGVNFAGSGSAATVAHSDHTHLGQTWTGTDNSLKISGSFSTGNDPAPLVLSNTTGNGLEITSAGLTGVRIGPSGFYGLTIDSAGWAGILVDSTEGDGLHINSADGSGVAVVAAGDYGVWAESNNVDAEGGHFQNSVDGGTGLYAEGGNDNSADLKLGGNDSSSDDGRIYTDNNYSSSDMLLVSNDAIRLDLDNDSSEDGDFWILNGNNTTVFAVNEDGDMVAIGTKSAAVDTADYGKRKLYAMESPQNWFEDFGSSQLVNGSVRVAIESIFAQTVNLTQDYYIFLTPLGDCPLYVAEKTAQDFTVRAMGGLDCSIGFDYRIVASRLGYENLRLEPATDLEPEEEGAP